MMSLHYNSDPPIPFWPNEIKSFKGYVLSRYSLLCKNQILINKHTNELNKEDTDLKNFIFTVELTNNIRAFNAEFKRILIEKKNCFKNNCDYSDLYKLLTIIEYAISNSEGLMIILLKGKRNYLNHVQNKKTEKEMKIAHEHDLRIMNFRLNFPDQ